MSQTAIYTSTGAEPTRDGQPTSTAGRIIAAWGLLGFALLLARGMWRLWPMAAGAAFEEFSVWHWLAVVVSLVAFGYGEGYRAIHRKVIPRLRQRAVELAAGSGVGQKSVDQGTVEHAEQREPDARQRPQRAVHVLYSLLAPLYCMGLLGANRPLLVRSWGMVVAIVLMILGMRFVPAPWREIILIGVSAALAWALLMTLVETIRMLREM